MRIITKGPKRKTLKERFNNKYIEDESTGCWTWIKCLSKDGYGFIHDYVEDKIKLKRAHRASWEIFRGPIPDRLCVLHKCDNTKCVNPEHLWLGTNNENMKDMSIKKRASWGIKNHLCKLSEFQVKEIRKMKGTHKSIANKFRVSSTLISFIKNNLIWKHI